jgi:hypothetical protein
MVSLKTKIVGYSQDFVRFKNKFITNIKNSEDFKEFLDICGQVLLYSLLGGLAFLGFISDSLIIKLIGIGTGLYLLESKFVPMIKEILSSLTLSKHYK